MSTSVTFAGGSTISPHMALIDTASYAVEPRTVVHDILDGPPIHTLRPAGQMRGTLHLAFLSERDATDAMRAHQAPAVFTVISTDSATLNFSYVVSGRDMELTIEPETATGWVLRVPFSEVANA